MAQVNVVACEVLETRKGCNTPRSRSPEPSSGLAHADVGLVKKLHNCSFSRRFQSPPDRLRQLTEWNPLLRLVICLWVLLFWLKKQRKLLIYQQPFTLEQVYFGELLILKMHSLEVSNHSWNTSKISLIKNKKVRPTEKLQKQYRKFLCILHPASLSVNILMWA